MTRQNTMTLRSVFNPLLSKVMILLLAATSACDSTHNINPQADPSQWVAVDALGREIDPENYPTPRADKQVGIFYFLWHGCHGYDTTSNSNKVIAPTAEDTRSPFNNEELISENPDAPNFGGVAVMHHWSEPHLGYYLSDDEWVMRRHAQLLASAGVDVIFFDVTNSHTYLPIVELLCQVYESIRAEGGKTPQIAFLLNTNTENVLKKLYEEFYKPQRHASLWYYWQEKPLILADPEKATPEMREFFTMRRSWFASHPERGGEWFGDGKERWTWGDYYPQQAGWVDSPDKPEQLSILPATHPHMNIGRSHNGKRQPTPEEGYRSAEGVYFSKQIERALEVDPQFVFITGWNEWTAQRQLYPPGTKFSNSWQQDGGTTFFVDQLNEEFSRDIEPTKGRIGDNYYYQMCDFVRQFKGATPIASYSKRDMIKIDGHFEEWRRVEATYADYRSDTSPRNHPAWGRLGRYVDESGRNDIVLSKVSSDKERIYFMVECAEPISAPASEWLMLFISNPAAGSDTPSWEGFEYVVNRKLGELERSTEGWNWESVGKVDYSVEGAQLEIGIDKNLLGIEPEAEEFTLDFKWIDNACAEGDIRQCMSQGDTAPEARFAYRYKFSRR